MELTCLKGFVGPAFCRAFPARRDIFCHLDGPVQLFRPVRADEGLQGLEEGQLPFVPTHLLGHLQKALKELHRVRLAWLLGQLRGGGGGVGADC